jgi:hypothetical protein
MIAAVFGVAQLVQRAGLEWSRISVDVRVRTMRLVVGNRANSSFTGGS